MYYSINEKLLSNAGCASRLKQFEYLWPLVLVVALSAKKSHEIK